MVYDYVYTEYHEQFEYRTRGAAEAAKLGAVASLISSLTSFSMSNPHTGRQGYHESEKRIPAAALTREAVSMFSRMSKRGSGLIFVFFIVKKT